MKRKAKIYYIALDDFWRKEEKLAWLRDNPIEKIKFERLEPDAKHNWISIADNDWDNLIPLIDKDVKLGKKEEAVFKLFSLGVVTARDEWMYGFDEESLAYQVQFLIDSYNKDLELLRGKSKDEIKDLIGKDDKREIKWTRAVINDISKGKKYKFDGSNFRISTYRPFVKKILYFAPELNEMQYQLNKIYPSKSSNNTDANFSIGFIGNDTVIPFSAMAFNRIEDYNCLSNAANGTKTLPLYRYDSENQKHENITDWALSQFQTHYNKTNGAPITKQDIFYYVYAALHSPVYRKKYEQNLKREFPRLPFYEDFAQWRDWGKALMDLHINYETQDAFALERKDLDTTAKLKIKQADLFNDKAETKDEAFIVKPKTKLRADKVNGTIEIDSHTTLAGVPHSAWEYKLGNRSALEWILDQYKEKTPQDATIREHFNTYKFEDYKEQVIDLLKRVTNVSVKTMEIVGQMPNSE